MDISGVKFDQPLPVYAPASQETQPAQMRQLIQAIKALNAAELFGENNELTFVLDRDTNRPLVRIINKETKEVIRQIPPEYALEVAKTLKLDG